MASRNSTAIEPAASRLPAVTGFPWRSHAGTIDSVVSPDGKFFYVESGGAGTIDAFAIGANGSLTQIETIFNIPVASEGLALS